MALLYIDGFDNYSSNTNMAVSQWSSVSCGANPTQFQTGRYGGYAVDLTAGTLNLAGAYNSLFIGMAMNYVGSGVGYYYVDLFTAPNEYPNTTVRCKIDFVNQQVSAYSSTGFSSYGNLLGVSAPGVIITNGWQYLEFNTVLDNTLGSVEIRANGATILSISGVDTQGVAPILTSSNVRLNGNGTVLIDDLYICDATTGSGSHANNTFLGDKRIVTLAAEADSSVQWTPNSPVTITDPIGSADQITINPNYTYCSLYSGTAPNPSQTHSIRRPTGALEASVNATLDSFNFYAAAAVGGANVIGVIYSENTTTHNTPGALYATTNQLTGISTGVNTLTFASPITLVRGTRYYFGVLTDTVFSIKISNITNALGYQSCTYPTPVANFVSAGSPFYGGVTFDFTYNLSNAASVGAAINNDGITYNSSSTIDDQDLLTTTAVVPGTATVYGAQVMGYFSKNDVGSHSAANLVSSGGTVSTGGTLTLGASYQYASDIVAVDPNTSAAWTPAAINSALIGYKVIS